MIYSNEKNDINIFWILMFILIIILIPLFIELILRYTNGHKTKQLIYNMALEKAKLLKKPLIVFNNPNDGFIVDHNKDSNFKGDIYEIVSLLNDDSVVILISETLEYIPSDMIEKLINEILRATGNNLYIVSIDHNSPRVYCDYKIINVINTPFNLPNSLVKYHSITEPVKKIHNFYSYVFKIIPYKLLSCDPINPIRKIDN
jgi:hypothetical protein